MDSQLGDSSDGTNGTFGSDDGCGQLPHATPDFQSHPSLDPALGGRPSMVTVNRFLVAPLLVLALWLTTAWGTEAALNRWWSPANGGVLSLSCGRDLQGRTLGSVSIAVPVKFAIVLDEEWRSHFGEAAGEEARTIMTRAAGFYRNLGIHATLLRVDNWMSPDTVSTPEDFLSRAEHEVVLRDADVAVIFTNQVLNGTGDGRAEVGGRYVFVSHHLAHGGRDEFVLAHEMGHIFGAHHGCDVPGFAGIMAESGFEQPPLVCPCTRRVLEINVDRFHGF